MKVNCIKNLYKSTYKRNIFIKGKEYEIVKEYRNVQNRKMCIVKSPIVLGDGGIDFFFDEGLALPYYNFNEYFKVISEL